MGAVQVAGLRIGYQRAGQGPALVLLHGAYEDSRSWRPQLEALSDEFTLPPEEVERRYDQVLVERDQPPEQFIPGWLSTLFAHRADPAGVQEAGAIMADFHPAGMWAC
ncbi:MAG TPA: hypothetical protein VFE00_02560 [Arthrobacter sp.]|nr:hypothetical protein [Arthrobacter sp.]